jgi:hypothetical protein
MVAKTRVHYRELNLEGKTGDAFLDHLLRKKTFLVAFVLLRLASNYLPCKLISFDRNYNFGNIVLYQQY